LVITALAAGAILARGNPVALPPTWPLPGSYTESKVLNLTAENVMVKVGSSESKILGDYTFRGTQQLLKPGEYPAYRINDFHRGRYYTNYNREVLSVTIAIPVILPYNGNAYDAVRREEWFAVAEAKATVGEHNYSPLTTFDRPEGLQIQPQLPGGWKLVFFLFDRLPVDADENGLQVRISYNQPHLPGNVSAYLPILPEDLIKTNYVITFQAQEGLRFTPAIPCELVGQPSVTNLSVGPTNLQLLKMQVRPQAPSSASGLAEQVQPSLPENPRQGP